MKRLFAILLSFMILFSFGACKADTPDIPEYPEEVQMVENMLENRPMSAVQVASAFSKLSYSDEQISQILTQASPNWRAQALRAAQAELDERPLSRTGIIAILTEYGYTVDEINYAISALGVRWEDQCLYVAMDYISQGYDKETVLKMLADDGFTQSEIAYVHAQHYALVEGVE
jgi:SOS response regulatory protein OraA/RecX